MCRYGWHAGEGGSSYLPGLVEVQGIRLAQHRQRPEPQGHDCRGLVLQGVLLRKERKQDEMRSVMCAKQQRVGLAAQAPATQTKD